MQIERKRYCRRTAACRARQSAAETGTTCSVPQRALHHWPFVQFEIVGDVLGTCFTSTTSQGCAGELNRNWMQYPAVHQECELLAGPGGHRGGEMCWFTGLAPLVSVV